MLRPSVYKILILGLLLPSAALALGLGDIQVESTLNQPLAAQIEIVGASPDTSAGLSATIPDSETFQRYGLERPASLASTGLTVRQDAQGHTVLVLRSTDAFTEPMVTLLVDLHSPGGELIREYTILLDPPVLSPEHTAVESAPAQPARAQTPTLATRPTAEVVQTLTQDLKPTPETYTVAPRDTLDRIAGIAGAHSRSDRRKMMIAIFRANPGAFQANLNNLRSGALLHLPSVADLSKISADEANHEFAAQMTSWRASDRRLASTATTPTAAAPVAAAPVAAPASPVAAAQSDIESKAAETAALTQRVESLEKSLDEMKQQLRQHPVVQQTPVVEHAIPIATEATLESVPTSVASAEPSQPIEDEPAPTPSHRMRLVTRAAVIGLGLAAGFGLALVAGVWISRRRRNEDNRSEDYSAAHAGVEQEVPVPRDPDNYRPLASRRDVSLPFRKLDPSASYLVEENKHDTEQTSTVAAPIATDVSESLPGSAAPTHEPTVKLPALHPNNVNTTAVLALHADLMNDDTAAREFAFFNPESTLNTTHVMLADGAEEPQPFVERRKNPADVLRQAIDREPDRSDLRLKLLELYYTAAAQNRRAFVEAVRQLAKNDKLASPNDWSQIADMAKAIAPDDELFAKLLDKKAVA
jgi:pilus assembly protein FimV